MLALERGTNGVRLATLHLVKFAWLVIVASKSMPAYGQMTEKCSRQACEVVCSVRPSRSTRGWMTMRSRSDVGERMARGVSARRRVLLRAQGAVDVGPVSPMKPAAVLDSSALATEEEQTKLWL